jgi:hypothetical protein
MKEEKQIKNMYPNRMGIAGETFNQSHGAEKPKKRAVGSRIISPVAIFIGRSRVFWSRPPAQNTVFPVKYS